MIKVKDEEEIPSVIKALAEPYGVCDEQEQIALAQTIAFDAMFLGHEGKRFKSIRSSAAVNELIRYIEDCENSIKRIDELSRTSLYLIEAGVIGIHPLRLRHKIRGAVEATTIALEAIDAAPAIDTPRGRPRDRRAQAVTGSAAVVFKRITGRDLTQTVDPVTSKASGEWIVFLEAI